jgi:hypothetical protein
MIGTYYASTAERLFAEAQATLDRHASGLDGRCLACGVPGSCPHRESAVAMFSRYHRTGSELAGTGSPVQWLRR